MRPPGFDRPCPLPANTRYVGPITDPNPRQPLDPRDACLLAGSGDPWVLLVLSTTVQGQAAALPPILDAVAGLPVRVLLTLGGALTASAVDPPRTCWSAGSSRTTRYCRTWRPSSPMAVSAPLPQWEFCAAPSLQNRDYRLCPWARLVGDPYCRLRSGLPVRHLVSSGRTRRHLPGPRHRGHATRRASLQARRGRVHHGGAAAGLAFIRAPAPSPAARTPAPARSHR